MHPVTDQRLPVLRTPGADADRLRRTCDPAEVPFDGTAAAPPDAGTFGQLRAFEALELASGIAADGYNVFATGPAGTGKRTMIAGWLRERAVHRPPPPDLIAVANFGEPLRPHAICVPTGTARTFAAGVETLVDDARRSLLQAFESDGYRARHRRLHTDADLRRADVLQGLQERATAAGVAIQLTPSGVITVPLVDGRPLVPDEAGHVPDDVRERYEVAIVELQAPIEAAFVAMREIDRETRERHRAMDREVAVFAIGHLVEELQERWHATPRIVAWLDALREDALANLDAFRAGSDGEEPEPQPTPPGMAQVAGPQAFLSRYVVNVLVANDPEDGAPVVVATDPSFYDLFGRVEYETVFGAAVTDHRHLRAGLLHRAAGGFLVLQAEDVLGKPLVWPRLKDVLRTGKLKIENMGVQYMLFPGVSLDPEPAEIAVTVVLVGSTEIYELLHRYDDDLTRLFKLRADFDGEMPRDADGVRTYAGLLSTLVRDRGLRHLDRGAMAALIEHGSRLAGHRDRLSTHVRSIGDVATEASHAAGREGAAVVTAAHVRAALAAQRRRSDLVEQHVRERTLEDTIHIPVDGAAVGQVNGLAVALLGDHEFGHPVRITAAIAPGDGEVVDIDREAKLSGPIHSKGVLILSGYLAGRYAVDRPLSLRASIVFEQSYGPIEGDSASTAELLALLSALSLLPVDQGVAVTGAVDQHGAVQAVGGVNEKIEGFFALCEARGLTGRQGVVLPEANLPHLMLDERVVAAVADGRFHVWPVRTAGEALALVTGCDIADVLVRERLHQLADAARAARRPPS